MSSIDQKKRQSVDKGRKGSNSMTSQLSRTARRFSNAIVPQLTKFEHIAQLQTQNRLTIQIVDISRVHRACEKYVLHNGTVFEPIEFVVMSHDSTIPLFRAQLSSDELVMSDHHKRIVSLVFGDSDNITDSTVIAKIRHPLSGLKMYEIVDVGNSGYWQIISTIDEASRCQIDSHSNFFRRCMSSCGITFVPKWWEIRNQAVVLGKVVPQNSFFKENAMLVSWEEAAENESRILILIFGLIQMVREGYPRILEIIKINSNRRKSGSN